MDEPAKVKGTVKCPEDDCSVNLPADEQETYTRHLERCHPEFVLKEMKRVGKIPEVGPLVGSMWLYLENPDLKHSKRSHNVYVMQVDGFSNQTDTVDAVSYTHLDVYKRQGVLFPNDQLPNERYYTCLLYTSLPANHNLELYDSKSISREKRNYLNTQIIDTALALSLIHI